MVHLCDLTMNQAIVCPYGVNLHDSSTKSAILKKTGCILPNKGFIIILISFVGMERLSANMGSGKIRWLEGRSFASPSCLEA